MYVSPISAHLDLQVINSRQTRAPSYEGCNRCWRGGAFYLFEIYVCAVRVSVWVPVVRVSAWVICVSVMCVGPGGLFVIGACRLMAREHAVYRSCACTWWCRWCVQQLRGAEPTKTLDEFQVSLFSISGFPKLIGGNGPKELLVS